MIAAETSDLLHTLAEVSIAFVGFSTIVAALRLRNDAAFRIYSIRDVAIVGLIALSASVLPLLLSLFRLDGASVWRIASLVFSMLWIVSAIWGIRTYRQAVSPADAPRFLIVGPLTGIIGNPVLCYNVIVPTENAGALYVFSLFLMLIFVSVSFVAATFHRISEA